MPKKIPDNFICPISRQLMTDPVRIEGEDLKHIFDCDSIKEWFKENHTNPLTNIRVKSKRLIKADQLWNEIFTKYGKDALEELSIQRKTKQEEKKRKDRIILIKAINSNSNERIGNFFKIPAWVIAILREKKWSYDYFAVLGHPLRQFVYQYGIMKCIKAFNLKKTDYRLVAFLVSIDSPDDFSAFDKLSMAITAFVDRKHHDFTPDNLLNVPYKILIRFFKSMAIRNEYALDNTMDYAASSHQDNIDHFIKKITELKLSVKDLIDWPTDKNGILLFEDFITYESRVRDLVSYGVSIDDFKQLKDFSPAFRKRLLDYNNGDWQHFYPLIKTDDVAIPWNKWMDLWRNERDNRHYNGVSFNEIIENEKKIHYKIINNQKGAKCKFSGLIENIKSVFCDKSEQLHKSFYDKLTIQDLWNFYTGLLIHDTDRQTISFDYPESRYIHYLLKSEIYTPKQIIITLTSDLKKEYENNNGNNSVITVDYLKHLFEPTIIKQKTDYYENWPLDKCKSLVPKNIEISKDTIQITPINPTLFDTRKRELNSIDEPDKYNSNYDNITGVKHYDSNPPTTNTTTLSLRDDNRSEYSQSSISVKTYDATRNSYSNIKSNQSASNNPVDNWIVFFCFLSGWVILAAEGICECIQEPIKSSLMEPPIKSSTLLVLLGAGTALLVLGKLIQCCIRPSSNASNTTNSRAMCFFILGVTVMVATIIYGLYGNMHQLNYNFSNDTAAMILTMSATILLAGSFIIDGCFNRRVNNFIDNNKTNQSNFLSV